MLKAKGIYYINAHSFMLLDRSKEECEMIMEKYCHYRMPDKLIINAEDEIITELKEDQTFMTTNPEISKTKHFRLNYRFL